MNIFEQASKERLRFPTNMGTLTVEDLWHMKLKDLDDLAMSYKKDLSESSEESFLTKSKLEDKTMKLRFEIAKSVIESRVADLDKSEKAEAKRLKNAKIMELIVAKQDDELKESSIEELRAMLSEED